MSMSDWHGFVGELCQSIVPNDDQLVEKPVCGLRFVVRPGKREFKRGVCSCRYGRLGQYSVARYAPDELDT